MLPTDAAARKGLPIFTGVLMYFPDAIAAVADVSKKGNDQHNPGQPLHWAREKSTDHLDCAARHLIDAGIEGDGKDEKTDVYHLAQMVWRGLARLQLVIEKNRKNEPVPIPDPNGPSNPGAGQGKYE